MRNVEASLAVTHPRDDEDLMESVTTSLGRYLRGELAVFVSNWPWGRGEADTSCASWMGCSRRQSRLEGKIMSSSFQLPRCLQAALLGNVVYNMTMSIIWLPA